MWRDSDALVLRAPIVLAAWPSPARVHRFTQTPLDTSQQGLSHTECMRPCVVPDGGQYQRRQRTRRSLKAHPPAHTFGVGSESGPKNVRTLTSSQLVGTTRRRAMQLHSSRLPAEGRTDILTERDWYTCQAWVGRAAQNGDVLKHFKHRGSVAQRWGGAPPGMVTLYLPRRAVRGECFRSRNQMLRRS